MIDVSVVNVTKAFQLNKNVLDGLSFEVNSGEKIGILGKNGAGKTTLFKIITGELECDEGDVSIAQGKRVGLISQIPEYPERYTVEQVLRCAFDRQAEIALQMRRLEERMDSGDADDAELKKYGELSALFEHLEGYDTDYRISKVCSGLEISDTMRERLFSSLSGGEKTRINLARLLLENTDILLLDEPTNHLDISGVEWLEEYLGAFKGTVLTVSHDRYFLDRVVTRIVEIDSGKAHTHSGNYTEYIRFKTQLELEQRRKYEKEQAKIKQLQFTAERMHGWGLQNEKLMKRSQAIEKRIERLSTVQRPAKERQLRARFSTAEFKADELLVMEGVRKGFREKPLFEDVNLLVKGSERIGVIGDNGAGKTTLLKMIMGQERPDAGRIHLGPAVKTAYLPQQVSFPNPGLSLVDTVIRALDCTAQTARNRLGSFEFRGEDAFKCVYELSGGEKSRLALCILMDADVNLLILDEPTNHLDVPSRNWIEEAVEDYEGALIFVSHDRYFIRNFADRIWVVENGKVRDIDGGYDQYRLMRQAEEHTSRGREQQYARSRQVKPQKQKNARDLMKELKASMLAVEKSISAAERDIAQTDAMIQQYSSDYEKLSELFDVRQKRQAELDTLMAEWEELGGRMEEAESGK